MSLTVLSYIVVIIFLVNFAISLYFFIKGFLGSKSLHQELKRRRGIIGRRLP